MKAGCIYYTDFHVDYNIMKICQKRLQESFDGEIVSVSLNRSLDFGKNIILNENRGNITMFKQILLALKNSTADYIFFCEHDVLYNKSHFDFVPGNNDIFYYNTNVWQWIFPKDLAITYDNLKSVSSLCVNKEFAIDHYEKRLKLIREKGWQDNERYPYWVRRMGYEPGVKSKRQELIKTNGYDTWHSKYPNIDIRHTKTLTPIKSSLKHFKHKPENWRQDKISKICPYIIKFNHIIKN